jgi:hypothetical protein
MRLVEVGAFSRFSTECSLQLQSNGGDLASFARLGSALLRQEGQE